MRFLIPANVSEAFNWFIHPHVTTSPPSLYFLSLLFLYSVYFSASQKPSAQQSIEKKQDKKLLFRMILLSPLFPFLLLAKKDENRQSRKMRTNHLTVKSVSDTLLLLLWLYFKIYYVRTVRVFLALSTQKIEKKKEGPVYVNGQENSHERQPLQQLEKKEKTLKNCVYVCVCVCVGPWKEQLSRSCDV